MKIRSWVFGLFIILLIGCPDDNKQTSVTTPAKTGMQSGRYKNTVEKPVKEPRGRTAYASAKTPAYLEQNWDHETRMEWWYTTHGSRLLPYEWFLALERPDNGELIGSKENLEQFRFAAWPADPK